MPDWNDLVRRRLAPLSLPAAEEAGLAEELSQHLEDRYRELLSGGTEEADAYEIVAAELDDTARLRRRAALPEMPPAGGPRSGSFGTDLARDLRYAFRTMRQSPLFVTFVVGTLALGIGANTTVFTVVNGLILNPLPVRDAARLVAVASAEVAGRSQSATPLPLSYPDLRDYRERNQVFSELAGYTSPRLVTLEERGATQSMFAELVTANYFAALDLTPASGRFFLSEEDSAPGAHPVAVMNYATWQRRFGGEAILGRTLRVNGLALTVVGVAPPGFIGVNAVFGPDLWIPAAMAEPLFPSTMRKVWIDRGQAAFFGVGRLRPGLTLERANGNMAGIAAALAREFPNIDQGHAATVQPIREAILATAGGPASSSIFFASAALLAVVGIVLLIACSNVANLLLARSAARRQEIAVRMAMGASRARLVRQMLTESLLLGLLGGALGVAAGYAGLRLVYGMLPGGANFAPPRLDATVFGFTLLLSLATGLLFGLIPAFKASSAGVAEVLKEEARTIGRSRRRVTLSSALLVGQVALSFILLITAALVLRSIGRAYQMDPGFQTAHLAVFTVSPGQAGYSKAQTRAFYKEVRERVAALPGIQSASWASNVPLWARPLSGIEVEGWQKRSQADTVRAIVNTVDVSYFETAGVALENGREFTALDRDTSAPVAIVNEKMARDYWPSGALGKRIRLPGETRMREIVGVARNANYTTWGEPPQACVYVPLAQNDSETMNLYIRTAHDPRLMMEPAERVVHAAGPMVLMMGQRTGREIVDGGLFQARVVVVLLTVFGLLALGLASIGLYGILAYSVARRRREIGVRLALGASRASVLRLIIGEGMTLVLAGLAIGFVTALAAGRLMSRMLYGVSASDPLSLAAAVAVLSAVALLACYLPARWATRVDPLTALRES